MKYWKASKINVATAPIIEGSSHPNGGSDYGEWTEKNYSIPLEDSSLTGLFRQVEKHFDMKSGSWIRFSFCTIFFREDVIYKNGSPHVREIHIEEITYKGKRVKIELEKIS